MKKFILIVYLISSCYMLAKNNEEEPEIPLTEDLMREHGVLNRVLLIYEENIKRINKNHEIPVEALKKSVEIIKSFIEDYHEKLEEDYIFPLFKKNNSEFNLVKTLKIQHHKGRQITAKLGQLSNKKDLQNSKNKRIIKNLLQKFITMYRPHEAREDTVLFPKVRSLIDKKKFDELSEKFEDLEHKLFGKKGFETVVKKVENIEKELGIYNLEKFTPIINPKNN